MSNTGLIKKFLNYLNEQLGSIYVWGAQGETGFDDGWIKKHETNTVNANRAITLFNKRKQEGYIHIAAYDCSGLIVRFLLDNKLIAGDSTAQGLYGKCENTLAQDKLVSGDFVFRYDGKKIYHVGVYIGNDEVIHAKGRDYGVIRENIKASGINYWNKFGHYVPLFGKDSATENTRLLKLTTPYMSGNDVKLLQNMLSELNYKCGPVDAVFGKQTDSAVRLFQKNSSLTVDGIVGAKTVAALKTAYNSIDDTAFFAKITADNVGLLDSNSKVIARLTKNTPVLSSQSKDGICRITAVVNGIHLHGIIDAKYILEVSV